MVLKATCQVCGRLIVKVEKDQVSQDDIDMYQKSSSCEVDGPFPSFDDEGNLLPLDTTNIIVTKTQN